MDRERVEIELGLMLADMNNGALTINRFAIRVDCLMRAILTDTPDDDGWIDWRGGKCPVADGTRLDIELRDGDTATNIDAPEEWIWDFDDEESSGDIIRYRVVEPAKPAPPGVSPDEVVEAPVPNEIRGSVYWFEDCGDPNDYDQAAHFVAHGKRLAAAVRELAWYIDSPRGGGRKREESAEDLARAVMKEAP